MAAGPKGWRSFISALTGSITRMHPSCRQRRRKPLGPAHSLHADIANAGGGRFSHWDSRSCFLPRTTPIRARTVGLTQLSSACCRVPSAGCSRSACSSVLICLRTTRIGFAAITAIARYRTLPAVRVVSIAVVSLVVTWGFAGLVATRNVQATSIKHLEGKAYVVAVPERRAFVARTGDSARGRSASALQVLEDGRTLGPDNTPHTIISEAGGGRYSHWHEAVVFSSSDNSDPRSNRRGYQLTFKTYPGIFSWLAALLAVIVLLATPRSRAERLIAANGPPAHVALRVLFLGVLALALVQLGLRFFTAVTGPVNMQAPAFGSGERALLRRTALDLWWDAILLEGSDVALTPNLYRSNDRDSVRLCHGRL